VLPFFNSLNVIFIQSLLFGLAILFKFMPDKYLRKLKWGVYLLLLWEQVLLKIISA
jgi:hypothetical protein